MRRYARASLWMPRKRALPAVLVDLDRTATAPAGEDAILVMAHARHGVGQPQSGADQGDHEDEGNQIHYHTVPIVVAAFRHTLKFGEIGHRGLPGCGRALSWLGAAEFKHPRLMVGRLR